MNYFAALSLMVFLAACSSDSNNSDPVLPVFNPSVAPQNVQVVSGDGDSSAVQNTISWTREPDDPDYVVYVDTTTGVDEASSVVIPAASGYNYVIHSGLDVVAGSTYYYRVQAVSGGKSSILSAEVAGTPQQSMTNNALNDVAWNGTTLVAVGDSGVILNSPNGMADAWVDVSGTTNNALTGVTWESVNSQFLIVGAGSTVLTGDGATWNSEDLSGVIPAANLEDVAWLGDRYIAVGKNGVIIISIGDGSVWTEQFRFAASSTITLKGVAGNGTLIVVVGTNGTMLTSNNDGVTWTLQPPIVNNDLNDISWDGNQFGVVGSNDTILTSPDGITWTSHIPGTPDITFVAASQWDSSLPVNPVLAAVGSAGTFVVRPHALTGFSIPTGTNEQLAGITWVDNVTPPYFVMVGNDGTVLTSQLQ